MANVLQLPNNQQDILVVFYYGAKHVSESHRAYLWCCLLTGVSSCGIDQVFPSNYPFLIKMFSRFVKYWVLVEFYDYDKLYVYVGSKDLVIYRRY